MRHSLTESKATRERAGTRAGVSRRDRREGEAWTRTQRLKNWVLFWMIRVALVVADRLPRAVLLRVGRAAGRASHLVLARARATARTNLLLAYPGRDVGRVVRQCFVQAGENLGVSLLLRRNTLRARDLVQISVESAGVLQRALGRGRGVVFVSAHLGPYELIPAAIAELGLRPAIVVRESYDPRLNPLVDHHRWARGSEVIHRGDRRAPARILRALRGGRPVGFLPDLGGRVRSTIVDFLGQSVPWPEGPQRIAARMGSPILMGTLVPSVPGSSHRFSLDIVELDGHGQRTSAETLASALGRMVLSHPSQWLWMARPPIQEPQPPEAVTPTRSGSPERRRGYRSVIARESADELQSER